MGDDRFRVFQRHFGLERRWTPVAPSVVNAYSLFGLVNGFVATQQSQSVRCDMQAIGFNNWPVPAGVAIDTYLSDFYNALGTILDKHAPLKTHKVRRDTAPLLLQPDTLSCMRERDRARASHDQIRYRTLRNKCVRLTKRDRIVTARHKLLSSNATAGAAWSLARSHLSQNQETLPLLTGCTSNEDSATLANNYFAEKVVKLRSNITPPNHSKQKYSLHNLPFHGKNSFSLHCVGVSTVKKVIRNLKMTKSIGVDGIPMTFWKQFSNELAVPITHLVNLSIINKSYPDIFKQAIVHPIHKGKGADRSLPASYRPISILPALSKILERIVSDQLAEYLEENEMLPAGQHGFRKNRSTTSALVNALHKWSKEKGVSIASFDYSAAFDTLCPRIITERLCDIGATDAAVSWFESYLENGRQMIDWNGSRSSLVDMQWGVRQGSILGPLLFILVTINVELALGKKSMAYADDTSAWNTDLQALAQSAERLVELSSEMSLALNPSKTQLIQVGTKGTTDNLKIGGCQVSSSSTMEILGYKFDSRLSSTPYIESMIKSLAQRLGIIRRLKARLPNDVLAMISRSIVLGKAQVYANLALKLRLIESDPIQGHAQRVQVILNDIARVILGLRRRNHVAINQLMDKSGLKSVNHIVAHSSGMLAWSMSHSHHPLHDLFLEYSMDDRTRQASENCLRMPDQSNGNVALRNAFLIWNACEALRLAKSRHKARTTLTKFIRTIPF